MKDAQGFLSPSFETLAKLADVLENKADFGLRLTKAYKENDRNTLSALAAECDLLIEKIHALHESHRASFHFYNKPFGFELHDARYGGLASRFATAKMRIADYLSGKTDAIEELDQKRLPLRGKEGEIGRSFTWLQYKIFATPNVLH